MDIVLNKKEIINIIANNFNVSENQVFLYVKPVNCGYGLGEYTTYEIMVKIHDYKNKENQEDFEAFWRDM